MDRVHRRSNSLVGSLLVALTELQISAGGLNQSLKGKRAGSWEAEEMEGLRRDMRLGCPISCFAPQK